MLKPAQLVTLRAFLDANSGTYGALDDQTAAETLNAQTESRVRATMSGGELFENTDATEFSALADADKSQWLALCAIDSINPANSGPAAAIATQIFGGGSTTLTALAAARTESLSPAATQGLPRVRANDVIHARALP